MSGTTEKVSFKTGDVVIVRRGRYRGSMFVVVGTEGEKRVLIADGAYYQAQKPKKKNVIHLQRSLMNLEDVAERVAGGKPLDNGWLKQRFTVVLNNSDTSCKQEVEASEWPKKK